MLGFLKDKKWNSTVTILNPPWYFLTW
jgi:hypothetical protein